MMDAWFCNEMRVKRGKEGAGTERGEARSAAGIRDRDTTLFWKAVVTEACVVMAGVVTISYSDRTIFRPPLFLDLYVARRLALCYHS